MKGVLPASLAIVMCVCPLLAGAEETPAPTSSPQVDALTLAYVSDYFSFVGTDDTGHVALALDNNRGRDEDQWQAEHFVVLHAEGEGWQTIKGNGPYENSTHELLAIPDSSFFTFEGTPATGMVVTSEPNSLILRIDPIPTRLSRQDGESRFWMGSAPALLEWKGRRLEGRVIYEYLFMPNFNRLTRTHVGLWQDFQGFYIGIEEDGDLYLHSQQSDKLGPLVGKLVGFTVFDDQDHGMKDIAVTVLDRDFALGFYRWPTEWRITWKGELGPGSARFTLEDRSVLSNWVIGGFAMGVIRGEIAYNERKWPFYGLVELLM